MTVTVTHTKVDSIADWTQAQVDALIIAGKLPAGTTPANLVLPSDWNANHTLVGMDAIELNIRGVAVIDMGGGNYTMTDAEAQSAVKVIVNEGVGSTLTYPTTSDSSTTPQQIIYTGLASNAVILSDQTGGSATTIPPGLITQIAYSADGFIIDFMPYYRAGHNGVVSNSGATRTLLAADAGKVVVMANAAPSTLTIPPKSSVEMGNNCMVYATSGGAGGLTIAPGAGVTIVGDTAVAANRMIHLMRDANTDTWYTGH